MPSYFHSAPTSGKLGRCKWISYRSLMLLSLRDVKTQHNSCNSIQLHERNFSHLMQLNVPICDMSKRPTSLDVFVHVRQSHLHFPSIRITPLWHQSAQDHCQLMIVVYCDVRATSHPLVMICTLNFLQNVPTVKLWGEVRFPLLHPCNVFTAFWANGDASPAIQSVQLRWDGLVEIGGKSDRF